MVANAKASYGFIAALTLGGRGRRARGQSDALRRSQAVIEFKPVGTIDWANEVFPKTKDYRLEEIRGKHHRLLLPPEQTSGPECTAFWAVLRRDAIKTGQILRLDKSRREVWLQASHNPVVNRQRRDVSLVKFRAKASLISEW